ncbi:dipeptidase [Paenibacillus endoradicis]|uniref:dipeptidase n=1 Tax=Paenibacillus endoradicis TaxID=2972487 RepID=UPI0021598604|nr:dipeptidase [Paenibacillus endoradicis]MCR8656335.1 dipeptidase [Paenibacillus endoradicis]
MRKIDFHCDVLSKMLVDHTIAFDADDFSARIDVTLNRLLKSDYMIQVFAIYIPSERNKDILTILKCVEIFYEKIISHPNVIFVDSAIDVERCKATNKVGAILSIEGVDGLQGHVYLASILHRLGVRFAGLTWNAMNWAADGVLEPQGSGLSSLGHDFVRKCNQLGITIDVSHLSEKSFWDVYHTSTEPIIASHSNVRAICDHPRNLTDEQIKAIIERDGLIGLTFVPWFVIEEEMATIDDLIPHIDHILNLGGENHIMFGSDFDGIDKYIDGLTNPSHLVHLEEILHQHYDHELVEKIMWRNAYQFLMKQW